MDLVGEPGTSGSVNDRCALITLQSSRYYNNFAEEQILITLQRSRFNNFAEEQLPGEYSSTGLSFSQTSRNVWHAKRKCSNLMLLQYSRY